MKTIKQKAVQQALDILTAVNAKFYVVDEAGTVHKNTDEIKTVKVVNNKPARNLKHPWGSVAAYYKPHLENMVVGEVVEIPFGDYTGVELQSGIASWTTQHWGKKSAMTTVSKSKRVVEVLRIK